MADAQGSGPCERNFVGVQVPPLAPLNGHSGVCPRTIRPALSAVKGIWRRNAPALAESIRRWIIISERARANGILELDAQGSNGTQQDIRSEKRRGALVSALDRPRLFQGRSGSAAARILDRNSAAQRHRPIASRSCPERHPARRDRPHAPDAGLTTRYGFPAPTMRASPRKTWSNANSPKRARPVTTWAAKRSSSAYGNGSETYGGTDPQSVAAARRLMRLEPRALHARPRPLARGDRSLRHALPRRPDLSRLSPDQLVSAMRDGASDLEVDHKEAQGHLWYIRYPFADGSGSITVATTRPETMLGDTAVAVNPDDERYTAMVGKKIGCR